MAYNSKFTGAQIDALLDASEAMQTSKEDVANKVTTIGADATDVQYPSAKAVKDKHDELETTVNKVYKDTQIYSDFVDGLFLVNDGRVNSDKNFATTDFIPLSGTKVVKAKAMFGNQWGGGVGLFDRDKVFITSVYDSATSVEVVEEREIDFSAYENGYYVRACTQSEKKNESYVLVYTPSGMLVDTNNEVAKIKETLDGFGEKTDTFNEFIDSTWINAAGQPITHPTFEYWKTSKLVRIANAESLTARLIFNNPNGCGIFFYGADGKTLVGRFAGDGGAEATKTLTIDKSVFPSDAVYVRGVADQDDAEAFIAVSSNNKIASLDLLRKYADTNSTKTGFTKRITNISEGDSIGIARTPNVASHCNVGFYASFNEFGRIRISRGNLANTGCVGKIEIDDTNVYVYDANTISQIIATIPHGLTLDTIISVRIATKNGNIDKATLEIITLGETTFEQEIDWNGCIGDVEVLAVSGNYTNAELNFSGSAWYKDVWIFGDSYTRFWGNALLGRGANNCMIDGYGGRGSIDALISFQSNILIASPKVLVWMLGMNDVDEAISINSDYKFGFDYIKSFCENNGIKLIVSTIPNTTTRLHTFKNAYIRESGVEIIDIATILGANEAGSVWYNGLCAGDHVHPTAKGSELIACSIVNRVASIVE